MKETFGKNKDDIELMFNPEIEEEKVDDKEEENQKETTQDNQSVKSKISKHHNSMFINKEHLNKVHVPNPIASQMPISMKSITNEDIEKKKSLQDEKSIAKFSYKAKLNDSTN